MHKLASLLFCTRYTCSVSPGLFNCKWRSTNLVPRLSILQATEPGNEAYMVGKVGRG